MWIISTAKVIKSSCQYYNLFLRGKPKIKKLASYSHRTATTARPCYIPVLGDSAGAGRIRLARAAKVITIFYFSTVKIKKNRVFIV
jgi:hypothetical protein